MKAWTVEDLDGCHDDGGLELVFAETSGKARAAADLSSDVDWTRLRVRRAPHFDECAPRPTDREYIERGWRVECSGCYRWVEAENWREDENGQEEAFPPVYDDQDRAHCSPACLEKARARDAVLASGRLGRGEEA